MTEERMLDEVEEVSDRICSEPEIDFLESCREFVGAGRPLTPKMHDWLRAIWNRACESPW